jgi:O-antigen/teichoic acid export membrane protein
LRISIPSNINEILYYSILIFLSGFGASIIIDVDAAMLGKLVQDEFVAYYKVAIFIAAIIDAPSRALFQILNPMVAETINNNNISRLERLYKKSSSNLLLVSGFISVLICSNIEDIYKLIYSLNLDNGFRLAIPVVFYISISKLSSALVGCVNSIITNSKYYYAVPLFTISSAIGVIFLNIYFIEKIGFIGAAISTMIIIILFNTLKLIFVMFKFKIQPFSKKTILISILIVTTYFAFYNLNLSADFLINLILKSILIFLTYLTISYFLNLSEELNLFLKINRKGKI